LCEFLADLGPEAKEKRWQTMKIEFSFQEHGISFSGEIGMRIAESTVYALYAPAGGGPRRAALAPGGCSAEPAPVSDVHGEGSQITLRGRVADGLELTYQIKHYSQRPFLLLRLSVQNLSQQAIYLHELVLLETAPGKLHMDPPDRGLDFFKLGWHGWSYSGLRHAAEGEPHTLLGSLVRRQYTNPTTLVSHRRGEFNSEGWAILAGERAALVVGLASMADQFGQVQACCRPGELSLRLVTQADGVPLAPGESFASEWGYLQVVPLPDPDLGGEYVCAVARQMGARTQLEPQLQWTHWYHFYQQISAEKFIANLEAITAARSQVPFQVVQLDDGYQAAWGDWTTTNAKFPHGLAALAESVRQVGYLPGLWLAPFVIQPGSTIERDHPDWLLHDERRRPINAGFFYQFFGRALDATHPAVQEHLRTLAETLTQRWGYGLLKLDFCYAAALPARRYDPRATRTQALRRGLEIMRQAAGDQTFLLGCGCPFGPAIGVVDAMRIGPDTAPTWEPWFNWAPWATRLLRKEPSPPALRNSLRHVLNLSALHRRWWWNDPDCLLLRDQDTRLSEAEVVSRVTLVGLSGGMVVDSDDVTCLPPQRLRLLSLLTPILSPGGQALDLLQRDMPELYHVPLQGAAGRWRLVGLFNWGDCPASKRLSLRELGFTPGQVVYVFDFWAARGWQTAEAELVFPEIPAHGCRLLRICELDEDAPALVGDTLHITQGLEIAGWQAESKRLELWTVDMGREVSGSLWLRLPVRPVRAECNGEEVAVEQEGEGVYRLDVNFTGQGRVKLKFS
jgi:alpha-galactosidase